MHLYGQMSENVGILQKSYLWSVVLWKGHSDPAFTLPELYDVLQRKINGSFSGISYENKI